MKWLVVEEDYLNYLRNIEESALKVYANNYKKPDSDLARRCIDFKKMEQLARKYKRGEG